MAATQTDGAEDDIVAGINVTPLVDITLVLLIIFMVTAKLVVQQGIPMDLPKAASAGATQSVFTVSVDADGKIYANGAAVSEPDLRASAQRALAENKDLRTVVQAAGAARHDAVLRVVDDLREVGIVKIAFAADRTAARAEAP
jgi:biopolymer transport protein ExbD